MIGGVTVMDCAEIQDNGVVDRYVLHQLDEAEAERFEEHYMLCDTCLEALERTQVMVRGMKRLGAEETAKVAAVATAAAWWRLRRPWMTAAAFGIVAVLALPAVWRQGDPGGVSGLSNVPVVYLQPERAVPGAEPSHQVRRPETPVPIVLVLELDPPFHPTYRAIVERAGRKVWESEPLELKERDALTLSLDSGQLDPGDYQLRLEANTAEGQAVEVGRFAFRAD